MHVPKEARTPTARVKTNCEASDVGAGNGTHSSLRAASALPLSHLSRPRWFLQRGQAPTRPWEGNKKIFLQFLLSLSCSKRLLTHTGREAR